MSFQNVGTSTLSKFTVDSDGHVSDGLYGGPARMTPRGFAADAAPSSGNAFLISELEKRDPLVRQPLTTYTWSKNIPVRTGGGFVDYVSALNIDFGMSGGSTHGPVSTNGSNSVPVVQANFGKDLYKAHIVAMFMRINEFDMEKAQIIGRSLDQLLTDGIRLAYEKHMDANVFTGLSEYGTTGLLNNPNVTASSVASNGATTPSTLWSAKTPVQILDDINTAITTVWAASGYDMAAIPNHVLIPFEQYNYIATAPSSELTTKSILTYLEENNVAKVNGSELVFGQSAYAKGAGSGSTDRMAVYVHNPRFLAVDELQPLTRRRSVYNSDALAFDTLYAANVSEVEMFYTASIRYFDGI